MPYLQEHGFGGSSLGLKRVINVFIQKLEPKALLKGDVWIKSDIPANKVLFLEEGLEAPKEEGNVWIILKDIEMKMVLEKIVKVFSNKKEINMDYSRNTLISNVNLSKLHVFKNKFMQIYSMFGIAKMYRNGKWEWLIADYWDGSKWVNFSDLELYVYYATGTVDKSGNTVNSTVKKVSSYDGSVLWSYDTGVSRKINSIAVDSKGFVYGVSGNYPGVSTVFKLNPDGTKANFDYRQSIFLLPTLTVDSNNCYFSDGENKLYKLTPQGSIVWQYTFPRTFANRLKVDKDGNVYATCGGDLLKISSQGTLLFEKNVSIKPGFPSGYGSLLTMAIHDDYIFIGTGNGYVLKISKTSGEILSDFYLTGSVTSVSTDKNNLIATVGGGRIVTKLSLNGNMIWENKNSLLREIEVAKNEFIYGFSDDKKVKKLSAEGIEIWSTPVTTEVELIAVTESPYGTFPFLW